MRLKAHFGRVLFCIFLVFSCIGGKKYIIETELNPQDPSLESEIARVEDNTTKRSGGLDHCSLRMTCRSSTGRNIQSGSCRFTSPGGAKYAVKPNLNRDGLSCYCKNSKKLCSIVLNGEALRPENYGKWRCESTVYREDGSQYNARKTINLYRNTVHRICDAQIKRIDGQWGRWMSWSRCPMTGGCRAGSTSRSRQCDSPAPAGGGEYCQGKPSESRSCNTRPCCPPGWKQSESYCYQWNQARLSWEAARQRCRAQGADLVSVHSNEENRFISYSVSPGHQRFWIGGQRFGIGGKIQWIWSDGSRFNFTKLCPMRPDTKEGNQDCLSSSSNDNHWICASPRESWDDKRCFYRLPFICKKSSITPRTF